ncbi:MAG: hypothetical protein K2V38_09555 [Gemmataceae bacterium]|nr:hypothetical protein [Gemmataceae bacterium]
MLVTLALAVMAAMSVACEAPTDTEVLKALPPMARAVPFVFEEFRDDVIIVKRPIAKKLGNKQVVPAVGALRVAEVHWECVAYYTQTVNITFPFPVTVYRPRAAVVYIDKQVVVKAGE